MKTIKIMSHEFIEDENGGYFKTTERYETFEDDQVRHADICTICGYPTYPECRNWCQNEEWAREKEEKEHNKLKEGS